MNLNGSSGTDFHLRDEEEVNCASQPKNIEKTETERWRPKIEKNNIDLQVTKPIRRWQASKWQRSGQNVILKLIT